MSRYREIKFATETQRAALGRNGYSQCWGVSLSLDSCDEEVAIEPVNSKGEVTRARVMVPVAAIPEVIKALQDLRRLAGQHHPLVCDILTTRENADVEA